MFPYMRSRILRILDLFCGIGGTAKGFQKWLLENDIDFEYVAVDIRYDVLEAHVTFNPYSTPVCRDAYTFSDKELERFDFIWASPPCETHSVVNYYLKRAPDMRLYRLIERLEKVGVPYVVENVRTWYDPPIKPRIKVYRHYLWSNLRLKDVKVKLPTFKKYYNSVHKLMLYHDVPSEVIAKVKHDRRGSLRDMVHWKITYKLASQIFPQIK